MSKVDYKSKFGLVQDQLELLQKSIFENDVEIAEPNNTIFDIKATIKELETIVSEEILKQKSLSVKEFLNRIAKIFVSEAHKANIKVALTLSGSGQINIDMVESSMAAAMACIRAMLVRATAETAINRITSNRYATFTFNLEIVVNKEGMLFSITDDSLNLVENESDSILHRINMFLNKMRSSLTPLGGWFKTHEMPIYGYRVQFKLPYQNERIEAVHVTFKGNELIIPNYYIKSISKYGLIASGASVASVIVPDQQRGFVKVGAGIEDSDLDAIQICVADQVFWVLCKIINKDIVCRKIEASEYVENHSWFSDFGIYYSTKFPITLPLFNGNSIKVIGNKAGVS